MRALIVLGLVLCACGPSMQGGGGDIRLAAAATAAGDSIELTLTNRSAQEIGYNLCTTAIERQVGDDWQPVRTDRVCTMELRTLRPGAEATYRTTLPPGTTAGDYRFHTTVHLLSAEERRDVRSNIVRVAA